MGWIAIQLGMMNRRLLLGQAMSSEREAEVRNFLEQQPSIEAVHRLRTRVVATGQFKLQAELDFDGTVIGLGMSGWVKQRLPENEASIEPFSAAVGEEAARRIASEVDRIEAELQRRFPELKFMDLEAD